MNSAIHRLHRGVREERNLVDRFDLGNGTRKGLIDITDVLGHRAWLKRCLFEFGCDVGGAELGVRTVVPFDLQGRQAFLCSPHMVGHDGDGIIEPHDLPHALHRLGRRIIQVLHAAAENR